MDGPHACDPGFPSGLDHLGENVALVEDWEMENMLKSPFYFPTEKNILGNYSRASPGGGKRMKLRQDANSLIDIYKELDRMRQKQQQHDMEMRNCVEYIRSMHEWASRTTKRMRELEEKCAMAENLAKTAEAEVLRMQEKLSQNIKNEFVLGTTRPTQRKRTKRTKGACSQNSDNIS